MGCIGIYLIKYVNILYFSWVAKDTNRPSKHIRHHSQHSGNQRKSHVRGPCWGLCCGSGGPGWPIAAIHQSCGSHTGSQTRTTQREAAYWRFGREVRLYWQHTNTPELYVLYHLCIVYVVAYMLNLQTRKQLCHKDHVFCNWICVFYNCLFLI